MESCKGVAEIEALSTGENSNCRRIVAPNEALSSPSAIAALGNCDTSLDFPVEEVSRESLENAVSSSPGSTCSSSCTDLVMVSCSSSNQSNEFLKDSFELIDPERRSSEDFNNNLAEIRSENTPTSELCPARKILKRDYQRSFSTANMPSRAEIEDFFAEAEKLEQKRFSEKYNFDIVEGVPLEGRYQWIPLKP